MSALFRSSGTAAFDSLYKRHATSVYRYAYAVLGNHADAEDVTQSTFLNAYRSLAKGTKPRKAENWLLTIAHNQIRQHFRSAQARPREVELDERLHHPSSDRSEPSVADVLRALQHLPPTQRAAIVMREFEGRTYAEMAEILGVTQSALEALLFRARRSLAEQLDGAFTCGEAEQALSRKLDGRLPRSDTRRLKAHLRECTACSRFEGLQRRQRTALKGLGVVPVPASILLFRGETAAAAAGLGAGTAAAGGSTAVGAGAAAGVAAGVTAKAAAVTAAAAVATSGVGYGITSATDPGAKAERKPTRSNTMLQSSRKATNAAAVAATRDGGRSAEAHTAKARGERPGPARPSSARAKAAAKQPVRPKAHPRPVQAKAAKVSAAPNAKAAKPVVRPAKPKPPGRAIAPEPFARPVQAKRERPAQARAGAEERAGAKK